MNERMIAHTIQLALAPVFVLVAIGNIMNILSTRLGRIVDRARALQKLYGETTGAAHDIVVLEMRQVDLRIELNTKAIRLLVMSGLAIGTTVAILFLEEMVNVPLERVAAGVSGRGAVADVGPVAVSARNTGGGGDFADP
jgi:hypothetical protein